MLEEAFTGQGGLNIHLRSWRPALPPRARDKTLELYESHFHDLLNDIGKEQVMADIVGWIDARIA